MGTIVFIGVIVAALAAVVAYCIHHDRRIARHIEENRASGLSATQLKARGRYYFPGC